MGLSNLDGHLVPVTGNKTELSGVFDHLWRLGGRTIPIKDVPKMLVWELARQRNEAAITREVRWRRSREFDRQAAERRAAPDQTDQGSLAHGS
jgi:NAD+ synthase (glutamine-hydrolysing)